MINRSPDLRPGANTYHHFVIHKGQLQNLRRLGDQLDNDSLSLLFATNCPDGAFFFVI